MPIIIISKFNMIMLVIHFQINSNDSYTFSNKLWWIQFCKKKKIQWNSIWNDQLQNNLNKMTRELKLNWVSSESCTYFTVK